MTSRPLKIVNGISCVILGASLLFVLAGCFINPWDSYLSLSDDFHVGIWNRHYDSRIVFFSDAESGPYTGSIIGVVDADDSGFPRLEREEAFGDSLGIYYRLFQWSNSKLWTLAVTLWYPIVLFAILPAFSLVRCLLRKRLTNAP